MKSRDHFIANAFIFILLAFAAGVSAQDSQNVMEESKRGQRMLDSRDCDGAIAAYTRVIAMLDTLGEAYTQRGLAYECKNDHDAAIRDFDRAIVRIQKVIDRFPADSTDSKENLGNTYYNRANSYSAKGDMDQALRDYTLASQTNPKQILAFKYSAEIYFKRNDWDNAIRRLTSAIALDATDAKYYEIRSICYGAKGDLKSALADVNKLVELNPKHPGYYSARAIIYRSLGNVVAAEKDEQAALALKNK